MSTRYVFPELFHATGAVIVTNNQRRQALRWLLHDSLGLPRALFHVWQFQGNVDFKGTSFHVEPFESGRLVFWAGGQAAVGVQLTVSVSAGSAIFTAHSAPRGTGHIVDKKTITGPVTGLNVSLTGNPVVSISVSGSAAITSVAIVPMQDFVNNPGWKLIETVGLPVTSPLYDTSSYPLDPQGPVGAKVDPVSAAIRRLKEGTPDAGWPATTDRSVVVPPFLPPDPSVLVEKELRPLLEGMSEVFNRFGEPSKQTEEFVERSTSAPRSVHGTDASVEWQARARPARFYPLGSILVAAGSDPFAALALGFGTTIGGQPQHLAGEATDREIFSLAASNRRNIYMITVQHKVRLKLDETLPFPFPFSFELDLEGELAAVYLGFNPLAPLTPVGLIARAKKPAGASAATALPHLDPPGSFDGRWLQTVEVAWVRPLINSAADPRPSGYAVAKGLPAAPMEIQNEERLSGGWSPVVTAASADKDSPASVRYPDTGVPEAFPDEPEDLVYSVAAQDWFGRWSGWRSADYHKVSVAPQVPAVRKVSVLLAGDILPTMAGTAAIEFTWDWSFRSPDQITLRVLTHLPGDPPPAVAGSVFSVGGPAVADLVISFSGASADSPSAGTQLITEENQGRLRTYRVEIPGLQLAFSAHPRIRVTARAHATERVAPLRASAWSRNIDTDAVSPIPPPPPFIPAAMQWASVPDPRGVARSELKWTGAAPLYAVYLADETALRRELDQLSADLETPAAERLVALRPLDFAAARRAFRRIADRVPAASLEIELPRGSNLIHFYGVVPISSTGVEGTLPASGNSYFAVAAPTVRIPEQPFVAARDRGGAVELSVEADETRVLAGRIEIYRAPSKHRSATVDMMGPPLAALDASLGVRAGGKIRWELEDPTPGVPWQSVFYRVAAFGATDAARGEYSGRSLPSRAVEVVPTSPAPPPLSDLQVEDISGEPDQRLVSFLTDVSLARMPLGVHTFTVQTVGLDGSIATRRITGDAMGLFSALPPSAEQPDSIFRFDPANPRAGRTYAWVSRELRGVLIEVMDPYGRTARLSQEVP